MNCNVVANSVANSKFGKYKVSTSEFQIDSFNIYIPIDKCDFVSESLFYTTEKHEVIKETGQVIKTTDEKTPYFYIEVAPNVELRYKRYKKKLIGSNAENQECLELLITAKHLLTEYFNGVRADNMVRIFNCITKLRDYSTGVEEEKLIGITYQNFIKYSEVLDIDFCRNGYITDSDVYLKGLKSIKKYSDLMTSGKSKARFKKDTDTQHYALYFGGKNGRPELKIYWKCGELLTKSAKFYNAYLKEYDITNLFRVEFNIPNNKVFKAIFNKPMTLKNVLYLTQDEIMNAYSIVSKKYLSKPIINKNMSKHDEKDIGILELLKAYNNNKPIQESDIDYYFNYINPAYRTDSRDLKEINRVKNKKCRHKKKLIECWNDLYREMNWDRIQIDQHELFNLIAV